MRSSSPVFMAAHQQMFKRVRCKKECEISTFSASPYNARACMGCVGGQVSGRRQIDCVQSSIRLYSWSLCLCWIHMITHLGHACHVQVSGVLITKSILQGLTLDFPGAARPAGAAALLALGASLGKQSDHSTTASSCPDRNDTRQDRNKTTNGCKTKQTMKYLQLKDKRHDQFSRATLGGARLARRGDTITGPS